MFYNPSRFLMNEVEQVRIWRLDLFLFGYRQIIRDL